jgi:hypothetical protein
MAAVAGNFATYNQVGIREDLEEIIYNIAPMDTYFFNHVSKSKARNTRHDWQTDVLDTPSASNAYAEGDDFSAQAITPTSKLSNYTQIARKDFVITRTANIVNTAGRKEELAYQTVLKGKALKRDIECSLVQNKAATVGTTAAARVSASAETWIYTTNHVSGTSQTTNTTPAPVGGLATTAGTDGSATALVEADFKNALQQAWSMGGETDVVLLSPTMKAKSDLFTGVATRFRNVAANDQAAIVGASDIYVSSFGSHKIQLSRYMRISAILFLDLSTWGVAWLDPIHMENIAKSGDTEKRMLVGEYTLVAKAPTANTKLTALV